MEFSSPCILSKCLYVSVVQVPVGDVVLHEFGWHRYDFVEERSNAEFDLLLAGMIGEIEVDERLDEGLEELLGF